VCIRGVPVVLLFASVLCACGSSGEVADGTALMPDCAVAASPASADLSLRPPTIPALRAWVPGEDGFELRPESRIVYDPASATALRSVAEVLAEDLQRHGYALELVAVAAQTRRAGDITLALGECDARVGSEGYRYTVADGHVLIRAREAAGAFYGTRTLLQLLVQGNAVPAGEALDWPRYPERGMMVDIGRKHFTMEWLRAHIRELAWLKMNYLHLHLSDDLGFRLESESHPEIVSELHLSKQQMRELIALAARYHITVVPEIDMPGHMEAILAPHPDYQLANMLGQRAADRLDVTNPDALRLVQDLLEEFLPLFPGPYWHTGADEVMPPAEYALHPGLRDYARIQYGSQANAKDAIHGFVNWVDSIVRAHGKITRMWHDDMNGGSAVTINPDIVVEWWTNFSPLSDLTPPTPQRLLDDGHAIMNAGWFPTYYTALFPDPLFLRPDMKTAYESWSVDQFAGPMVINGLVQIPPYRIAADERRNLGTKLHVWNDLPDVEDEIRIAAGIAPRLRVIAQKAWASPQLVEDYAAFTRISDAIGPAPGYTLH
jgi:hexosaminidase